MPFCPTCGKEVSEEADFCIQCGTNLRTLSKKSLPLTERQKATSFEGVPKKYPTQWIAGAAIAIIFIASFALIYTFWIRPRPEITFVIGHESLQGLNYVYRVDVRVVNNGGAGWVKVWSQISGAGLVEKQSQRISMTNGESRLLQFVFDISLWGAITTPSISYRAWAVVD